MVLPVQALDASVRDTPGLDQQDASGPQHLASLYASGRTVVIEITALS